MNFLLQSLAPAVAAFIAGGIVIEALTRLTHRILRAFTKRTSGYLDDYILDVAMRAAAPAGWTISGFNAWLMLPASASADRAVGIAVRIIITLLLVRLCNSIATGVLDSMARRSREYALKAMITSFSPMARTAIWILGIALFLQNIGVEMAAIWALLSAGGIGIGLALQEPISEFFEYVTILLDKPFEVGQLIRVDEVLAYVQSIGVRSTRLRSLDGEIIVMSNSALTGSVVANYDLMEQRRMTLTFGVAYATSSNTLKLIPKLVSGIVSSVESCEYQRCHLTSLDEGRYEFKLVYCVPGRDEILAVDAQQRINLSIAERFEKDGIQLAGPGEDT